MDLQEISDRLEIEAVMYRFAAGLDRRDWALYRSVFTDEIEVDYSSYRAESIGTRRADDWVARGPRLFPGLDASQHTITNVKIELPADGGGDRAVVDAYVRADHVYVDESGSRVWTLGGRYVDDLVRMSDGWRICAKRLLMTWEHGDRRIMDLAVERAARLAASI